MDVGHAQRDLADVGGGGERGLPHPVQAVLHRVAVGGGEDPQECLPDRACHRVVAGVVAERSALELPSRRHARGQDAVGGRRQRRVLVLQVVDESRTRGLHDREVVEAGLDLARRPGHGRAGERRSPLRSHEAVVVVAAVDPHAPPDRFVDPDARFRDMPVTLQEALRDGQGERLVGRVQVLQGQHVHQVPHGVGGHHRRVVGVRVGTGELAVQADGDAALTYPVAILRALHAQHADVGLSVALANVGHGGS